MSLSTRMQTRRRFIAAGAVAAAVATVPFAEAEATNCVRVTRVPLSVPNLPAALHGATIAQVADLHLFADEPHAAARHAIEMLERERPDLLVLTGDQWDDTAGARALSRWLLERPAGLPAVAILGNHDYAAGIGGVRAARLHELGESDLLVNRTVTVMIRGSPLQIAGLDDLRLGHPDVAATAKGLDADLPQLWLMHEPELMDRIASPANARPFVTLSGHTHGGQIRFPGVPPLTPQGSGPYVAGLYRTRNGPMYVSRGVGTTSPRIRVLCPPELPLFELRAASEGGVATLSAGQPAPSRRRFLTGL